MLQHRRETRFDIHVFGLGKVEVGEKALSIANRRQVTFLGKGLHLYFLLIAVRAKET